MPEIDYRKTEPKLTDEGPIKFFILKVCSGTSQLTSTDYFELTVRDLRNGVEFKDSVYLTQRAAWKLEGLCESVGLHLPKGGGFKVTTDDLEGRIGYGVIKHRELPKSKTKRVVAEFDSFWSREYAIEKAPELADIPDPDDAVTDEVTLPLSRKAKAALAATPAGGNDDDEPPVEF